MRLRILSLVTIFVLSVCICVGGSIVHASTYADKVLALSPIAYWQLNETSGTTAIDSSGNGHNGTYSGVTLNQIDGPNSTMGRAGLYDGINDWADLFSSGLASAYNSDKYTIILWFRAYNSSVWSGTAYKFIASFRGGASNGPSGQILKNNSANKLLVTYTTDSTYPETSVSSTDWTFTAIVRDRSANSEKWYVGSSEIDSRAAPADGNTLTKASIGCLNQSHPEYFFYGYIEHVAVFNVALSPSQIANLSDPNPPPTPTPTPTPTLTPTPVPSPSPTPYPILMISTLPSNGQEWALDHTISIGQIANVIPLLLLLVFLVVILLMKLARRR